MTVINVSRRQFLKSSAIVGGGLVVGFSLTGCSTPPLPIDQADGALLQLMPDNRVVFYCQG